MAATYPASVTVRLESARVNQDTQALTALTLKTSSLLCRLKSVPKSTALKLLSELLLPTKTLSPNLKN